MLNAPHRRQWWRAFAILIGLILAAGAVQAQGSEEAAYRIEIGDVLSVVVYGHDDLTLEVPVMPDGTIAYPFAPALPVKGLTAAEVSQELESILSEVVRVPVVSVSVRQGQGPYVVVLGEVNRPGIYPIAAEGSSLLEAIALAGGTTPAADLSGVKVFERGGIREYTEAPIGAHGVLFSGELTANPPLQVGNIVYVPPQETESEVFVLGEVRTPGAYPVQPGREVRLLDMIARAGGTTPSADLGRVRIYERGNVRDYRAAPIGAEGFLFEGELAENPPVQVGNIIYVPPNDADNEIFVLGEVRSPGAYPVQPGREVRLMDMIARAGGTTPVADLGRVKIYERGNVRDYREAPIGVEGSLFEGELVENPPVRIGNIIYVPSGAFTVTVMGLVARPGAYEVKAGAKVLDLIALAGGLLPGADATSLVLRREGSGAEVEIRQIDLPRVLTGEAPEGNVRLAAGDVLYVRPTIQVAVAGEVRNNGVFNLSASSRVTDAILAAGGVTLEADLNQLTISRQVDGAQVVIPVDYAGILAGRAENIALMDGDIVNVPRTVHFAYVTGEVERPGAYRVTDQTRLLDVVYAAGGPTAAADTDAVVVYAAPPAEGEAERNEVPTPSSRPLPPGRVDFTGRLELNPPVRPGQTVYVPKRTMEIFVLGSAPLTGRVEVPTGSRILDVVATVGGPEQKGDWRNVQLVRSAAPDEPALRIDVEELLMSPGAGAGNVALQPGDVVYVPPSTATVSVVGEVARPGTYTLPRDAKLIDAVAAAGGAQRTAELGSVSLLPQEDGYRPVQVKLGVHDEFSPDELSDSFRVGDGDVVVVPKSNRITWEKVIAVLTGVKLIIDIVDALAD